MDRTNGTQPPGLNSPTNVVEKGKAPAKNDQNRCKNNNKATHILIRRLHTLSILLILVDIKISRVIEAHPCNGILYIFD